MIYMEYSLSIFYNIHYEVLIYFDSGDIDSKSGNGVILENR